MEFSFTEAQKELCQEWREFLKKECLKEYVRDLDTTGRFPFAVYRKIAERGWLSLPFPTEYGGQELHVLDMVLIFEQLAHHALSVAQAVGMVWLFGGNAILKFGTSQQKSYYVPKMMAGEMKIAFALSEPDAGSDASAIRTVAECDGDKFIINGSKTFITGAAHSERMLVVARTDRKAPAKNAFTIFLVDPNNKGIQLRKLNSLGRHSPGTYEVFLDNVQAESQDVLGEMNAGWAQLQDALERERVCAAAMYVGTAQAALDEAVTYAKQHIDSGKPLARSQYIRHYLADMHMRIDAARMLTYRAAWQVTNGISCATEASLAKLFSSETFVYVADMGMQILGQDAYTDEWDMERHYRDAKASTIAGGTSEMQRTMISAAFLG